MLSIQGYIAKDLKEQGLLPEKYDGLVPKPLRRNVGSLYLYNYSGNVQKLSELDNVSDYNVYSNMHHKIWINHAPETGSNSSYMSDSSVWTMKKNWTFTAKIKVNSVTLVKGQNAMLASPLFQCNCFVNSSNTRFPGSANYTMSGPGYALAIVDSDASKRCFGWYTSYYPSLRIIESNNVGSTVTVKLENNATDRWIALSYALGNSTNFTVISSRETEPQNINVSGGGVSVAFGPTYTNIRSGYTAYPSVTPECYLRDIELIQEGEILFQRV